MGYFEDYHVYQTINPDGSITTDDFDFVPQQQGPVLFASASVV
jgi:hypothetical protein